MVRILRSCAYRLTLATIVKSSLFGNYNIISPDPNQKLNCIKSNTTSPGTANMLCRIHEVVVAFSSSNGKMLISGECLSICLPDVSPMCLDHQTNKHKHNMKGYIIYPLNYIPRYTLGSYGDSRYSPGDNLLLFLLKDRLLATFLHFPVPEERITFSMFMAVRNPQGR